MKKITLYGTERCSSCKQAKAYLEEKQIPFEYIGVGDTITAKEFIQTTGSHSVPVIVIGDEKHVGWNPLLFA